MFFHVCSRSRTPDWKTETKHLEAGAFENTNRRPIDWSLNFDKYQSEEHRLREHVRELAEQNVTLQREISGLIEESENQSTVTNCEQELKDQTMRLNELKKQNQDLSDSLVQLKEECNTGRDFLLD